MKMSDNEKDLSTRLGNIIRGHRISKNISQETLAERSNLTATYIGQLERGNMNPTVCTLYRITSALDISINELFDEAESNDKYPVSPELFRFIQYIKNLSPERIASIHQFLKDMEN